MVKIIDFRQCARRIGPMFLFALALATANGQLTYRDLHDFGDTATDGAFPLSNVSFDSLGNAYGTTTAGGANSAGMVWEITSTGAFMDLHDFGGTITNASGTSGPDGYDPRAGVSFDSQGNAYGTAAYGGPNFNDDSFLGGMVWEITAAGVYRDLHDFNGTITLSDGTSGSDGSTPVGGVTVAASGNLYGTANNGGKRSDGMVWEVDSGGTYTDLHDFGGMITNANGTSGFDGINPYAGVTLDPSGNLYGAAEGSGGIEGGMVWEIASGGAYVDLHDFGGTVTNANGTSGPDGLSPDGAVTLDSSGDLFGTTESGGGIKSSGMVWEITVGGTYKDLHDFGGTVINSSGASRPDGIGPYGGISLDSGGDIFGAAVAGGLNSVGTVWEIVTGGAYRDLLDFGAASGASGQYPYGGAELDSAGNLYGTTREGGSSYGSVWKIGQTARLAGLSLNPNTIGGLGTTTATITLASPALLGGIAVSVHAGASGYLNMPSTVKVPAGATSATFTITGTAQRPSTINMGIFASDGASSQEAILTIQGDSLTSFTLSPSQIKWTSGTSVATLTLSSAAPPGGWKVNLTPGVSGYVNMPTSVTIPAGSTSTTFSITGNALRFFTLNLGITAGDGGSKAVTTLVIAGDAVKSLSLSPSTIGWGGTSTATVNLVVAAPPGGWVVNTIPGASGYVSMPSSITVPAGATSATFTITAGSQRSLNLNLGIYANDGPSNHFSILTIVGSLTTFAYRDLHDFGGTVTNADGLSGPDGTYPEGGVSIDSMGNLYGTTLEDGPNGTSNVGGMVWEITSAGVYVDLHDFGGTVTNADGSSGPDGYEPNAGVTLDGMGNLYGTTQEGGPNEANNGGMVWEITSGGAYRDLHDFGGVVTNANGSSGPDGIYPIAGVTLDGFGDLFGTTLEGGPNGTQLGDGMVWEITPTGGYKDLHDFGGTVTNADGSSGPDGTEPYAGVTLDGLGDLFGTTAHGGPNGGQYGVGMVWEITSGGAYTDLHDFGGMVTNANGSSGPDGINPLAGVTLDGLGDVYGTTQVGGPDAGRSSTGGGMVWEITSGGAYKDLHDFGGTITNANGSSGPDGIGPYAGVTTLDSAGDLYGTTEVGGPNGTGLGDGMVWEITAGGAYKDLHDFGGTITNANGTGGPDGTYPSAGITLDSSGNLYGTASLGGPNGNAPGDGMVWELERPAHLIGIALNPNTIGGLGTTTGTLTLSGPAPAGGWSVSVHAGASGYLSVPSTVTVPAGATSVAFAISGLAQHQSTVVVGIFASDTLASAEATLTIQGDSVTSLTLNPTTITALGSSTATVTLASAAPPGGWVLTLHPGASGFVSMPTTLTVPAGATSATFTITGIAQHSSTINLGIFVSDGNSSQEAILTIT